MNIHNLLKTPEQHANDLFKHYGSIETAILTCDSILPCYINNPELTDFWLDVRSYLTSKKPIEITELQEY